MSGDAGSGGCSRSGCGGQGDEGSGGGGSRGGAYVGIEPGTRRSVWAAGAMASWRVPERLVIAGGVAATPRGDGRAAATRALRHGCEGGGGCGGGGGGTAVGEGGGGSGGGGTGGSARAWCGVLLWWAGLPWPGAAILVVAGPVAAAPVRAPATPRDEQERRGWAGGLLAGLGLVACGLAAAAGGGAGKRRWPGGDRGAGSDPGERAAAEAALLPGSPSGSGSGSGLGSGSGKGSGKG